MSQLCGRCNKSVYKRRYMPIQKIWLGMDCGCLKADRAVRSTASPFNLTLDHVHDEWGNKLHVDNIQQLSAAEKRYGFQSVVLNSDEQNFDDPPQQRQVTVSDLVRRKFGR